MANNYTLASFVVPVKDVAAAAARIEEVERFFEQGSLPAGSPLSPGDLEVLNDGGGLGFAWERQEAGIWIGHEESIDLEKAIAVAQILLRLDGSDEEVGFEWAYTCSAPRIGEFGGGCVLFTKSHAEWSSTAEMLRKMSDRREGGER